MSRQGNSANQSILDLMEQLYCCICGRSPNASDFLRNVTHYITQYPAPENLLLDESSVISQISHKISSTKSQNDVALFMSLNEQLSTCAELRNRNAILTFLLLMSESNNNNNSVKNITSKFSDNSVMNPVLGRTGRLAITTSSLQSQSSHSNIQIEKIYPHIGIKPSLQSGSSSENVLKVATIQSTHSSESSVTTPRHCSEKKALSNDLIEDLVQDVIYAFTGIQGKYLKKNIFGAGFKLDPKSRSLNVVNAGMLLRLAEMGYYHDQIQSFIDPKSGRRPIGFLGQGLISAYEKELTQYYGMVALLQEQLNRQRQNEMCEWSNGPGERLTLMKVLLWANEPMHRLQWLSNIAEECQEKKGGELASKLFSFLGHGDPTVKALVHKLLMAVCESLQFMLKRWLLEGEINDPHNEFFIEIIPSVGSDNLWHDKYRIRESMLPKFITTDMAHKILVTGKSINYLREVCMDKTSIKGREELRHCFEAESDNLFAAVSDTNIHLMIDEVYLNTSKMVLDIILGPHKLLEHLQALRRYLLFGQGDFVGLLMEQLYLELSRPAKDLFSYNLSRILDTAIRSTNAQYDDLDIGEHLGIRIADKYIGDIGWDVFYLQYTVNGPLSTILQPSMNKYLVLFRFLWRSKRIEYVVTSKIWREQICYAKMFRSMKEELNDVTYLLNILTSQMIHFIQQMQYYILFEVIECNWAFLLERVRNAKALDDILEAHSEYLQNIFCGLFLDSDSKKLEKQLKNIYAEILKLEIWQEKFFELCTREFEARRMYELAIKESESTGKFGETAAKRLDRDNDAKEFSISIISFKNDLTDISKEYEGFLRGFLLKLASNNDNNLQMFGMRLDFNEYYKKRDQSIAAPLTFEHLRMTNMFQSKNLGCSPNIRKISGKY